MMGAFLIAAGLITLFFFLAIALGPIFGPMWALIVIAVAAVFIIISFIRSIE